ncbi:MAG: Rieske 2Fe-2S domain-containing protein, partial [Chloroflexota bacterium]|nr:Rieske 2Fe-2S domain-containing protein [Chloroflexota bacterium]
MLTFQENETLARVGPGTGMGETMRRYWVPAILDWELPEPDCPPIRVRLLGEELVAFRDTDGRVGVVDNYCPHRRASLFFGRNEECGIRCVYHGWKFDVNGDCVDMPSEPAESNFKDKVKIKAYPTAELGNVIWVYMGPPDKRPPLPELEWTQVPELHRGINKVVQKCNWMQGLEGGIDTVHINFLHRNLQGSGIAARDNAFRTSFAARVEVVPTDYGYTYAGIRDQADDNFKYVRAYHFIAPWTQLRPNQLNRGGQPRLRDSGHMWVPIDDYTTMVWNFTYSFGDDPMTESERRLTGSGNELGVDIDYENGFQSRAAAENDYFIDREVQRTQTFSGIPGTNTQD